MCKHPVYNRVAKFLIFAQANNGAHTCVRYTHRVHNLFTTWDNVFRQECARHLKCTLHLGLRLCDKNSIVLTPYRIFSYHYAETNLSTKETKARDHARFFGAQANERRGAYTTEPPTEGTK